MGNEVKGVQQEVVNACDGCVEIPRIRHKTFVECIGYHRNYFMGVCQ